MTTFNSEERLRQLFEEFQKADQQFEEFKQVFTERILPLIKYYYPALKHSQSLEEAIGEYATATLNSTYTVIDKDVNFNSWRKEQELLSMQSAVDRMQMPVTDKEFMENIRAEAKKMITDYLQAVFSLSAFGFRLLELNTKMYNRFFILSLLNEQQKQDFNNEVQEQIA